jgi:hypothetical protein
MEGQNIASKPNYHENVSDKQEVAEAHVPVNADSEQN